jgi:hypothetical protein
MAVLVMRAAARVGARQTSGIVKVLGRQQFASTGFCSTVITKPRCTG